MDDLDREQDELQAARRRAQALEDENETLREALDRARTTGSVILVAAIVVVSALLAGAAVAWFGPGASPPRILVDSR